MAVSDGSAPPGRTGVALRVLRQVQAAGVIPLDAWHLAALLEMEGWNDARARDLGHADILTLARVTYPEVVHALGRVDMRMSSDAALSADGLPPLGRHFLRGVMHCLPMLMAAGVWVVAAPGMAAAPAQAIPVGLALWSSLLAAGGFQQVLVYRGERFLEMNHPKLALQSGLAVLGFGGTAIGVAALGAIGLAGSGAAALFAGQSLLWLSAGLLYLLQWHLPFLTVLMLLGSAIYLLPVPGGWTPERLAGVLTAAALLQTAVGAWGLWRKGQQGQSAPAATSAPGYTSAALRPAQPFWRPFLHGLLFAALLFGNRAAVWLTAFLTGDGAPALRHEGSMVWAGLLFSFAAGCGEVGVRLLSGAIHLRTAGVAITRRRWFRTRLIRWWLLVQGAISLWGVGVFLCGPSMLRWLETHPGIPSGTLPTETGTGAALAVQIALAGFGLLACGLFNLALLSATGRDGEALWLLMLSVAANLLVMALWPGPERAAAGFAAGGATLALLGALQGVRALLRADYLLFSSI